MSGVKIKLLNQTRESGFFYATVMHLRIPVIS
ncbi:hypothetical protein C7434_3744 [Pantoea sp. PNA 14-12]|nr:hypothetical protein C7427_105269 [Pantoea ananatis]TDS67999.1 hypothetical protein C7434_3744 [Pantoea sp. PNA 14-12]